MLLDRKFNEDSKNVIKNVIRSLQTSFKNDLEKTLFKTVFLSDDSLTLLFSLTVPNFVMFLELLDRKFNEDSKNVLKNVIQRLQMGFTDNFFADCP